MKGWLTAWNQPMMEQMEGHDMSAMKGMMSQADMDALEAATGAVLTASGSR